LCGHGLFEHLDARGHFRRITLGFGGGGHPVAFDEQLGAVQLVLNLKKGVQGVLRGFIQRRLYGRGGRIGFCGKNHVAGPGAEDATGANG